MTPNKILTRSIKSAKKYFQLFQHGLRLSIMCYKQSLKYQVINTKTKESKPYNNPTQYFVTPHFLIKIECRSLLKFNNSILINGKIDRVTRDWVCLVPKASAEYMKVVVLSPVGESASNVTIASVCTYFR